MKRCDTCGIEMNDVNASRMCAKCLLGAALCVELTPSRGALVSGSAAVQLSETLLEPFDRQEFFDKYEILERVAQGGQGDIWKVWDRGLRRCVAMKRLSEQGRRSPAALYRFLAEAQIASQLQHPGILPILDIGLDPDGRPFYSAQLLPGTTFDDILHNVHIPENRDWTVNRALQLLIRVCDVMAYAHHQGVIHRDLKPSNVLVGAFGDVRIIDWGSAYIVGRGRTDFQEPIAPSNEMVQTGHEELTSDKPMSPLATSLRGQPITVLFAPPEILRGEIEQLGPETDIYSVGVMLYQLLAGRVPYADAEGTLPNRSELRERIFQGPPTPVQKLRRTIPRDLASICHKAMAHAKTDRYRIMEELGHDLQAVLEIRPVQARSRGVFSRLQMWAKRSVRRMLST